MDIHIARNGKQFGPFPLEEVKRQLATGQLVPSDMGWTQGAKEWLPLAAFPALLSPSLPPDVPAGNPLRSLDPTRPFAEVVMPQRPPETSGLAIASLVFGILSITLIPILSSVPAVICGHVAHSTIRGSGGRIGGAGMALAGLVMGYLGFALIPVLAILAGIALPVFGEVQLRGKETQSLSHAKQIGTACALYALDHHDAFPPTLDDLVPEYLSDRTLFTSPLSPGEAVAYDYFGGTTKDAPDKVLLMSKFKDRRGKRIIVLVDGSGSIRSPLPNSLPPIGQ